MEILVIVTAILSLFILVLVAFLVLCMWKIDKNQSEISTTLKNICGVLKKINEPEKSITA